VGPPAVKAPRRAFYALRPGGWRDYVTLLHLPYTAWHLSYVVIGAALAPRLETGRLLWTLLAFALALGVGAHALDELVGRPLRTEIPRGALVALAAASIVGAVAIGIGAAFAWTAWLLAFVAAGAFLVVAYNLELFGGRLHGPATFALAWGAFPVLTAYFASAERITDEAVAAAAFAALLSLAQHTLSTAVRRARRRAVEVSGTIVLTGGETEPVTVGSLTRAPERALLTLAAASVVLAVALVLRQVT
jgi:hypothetical protein